MERPSPILSIIGSKKATIILGISIILIAIIDLLVTRQLLPYNDLSQSIMFILTVSVGYGVGSWILLEYAHRVSKEIRNRSLFCNIMHWSVIITQFALFGVLLVMLFLGTTNHFSSRIVFAISSILATIIMGAISIKFFSWYKASNYKSHIVLFYAIAALTLSASIAEDAFTKIMMVNIIQEKTLEGTHLETSFLYKDSKKYNGQIIYKEVKSDVTTLYIVPNSLIDTYNLLNSIVIPIGFVFRWIASTMLLRNIYQKITKLPISFWIILSIPLIIYLIGKLPGFFAGESLAGIDEAYRFYFRILFRAGTIAGNILFGFAFFMVAKSLINPKLKDYLILAGIGDTLAGISLSTSAIEPTYGVSGHSLVLISSYLFTLGLYSSAISVSSDLKLRQSIRESAIESSNLLVSIGSAQIIQEIEKKVMTVAYTEKERLEKDTGVQPSLTESEMRQYLSSVLKEIKVIQNIDDIIKKGKNILDESSQFIICSKPSGLRLAYNNYFDSYQRIMTKRKDNEHKGIRMVTTILDKDNADIVSMFIGIGVNIRHIKNIPPIEFAVSDKEMISTMVKTEEGQSYQNLLTTNEQAYIELFVSIFEELWKNGIDAKYKINDIEKGIDSRGIDIIQNPEIVQKLTFDLIKSAKNEILGIFSTANSFHRQEYAGTIQLMKEKVESSDINVRVLVPRDNLIERTIDELQRNQILNKIDIRLIEPFMQTKVSIMVIDKKYSLVIELKDDTKQTTEEAIGLATYSDSKSTVLSYSAIFENLWKQIELYEQLQMHEKMQKEFINIAAHELRTPIQPILGMSNILKNRIRDSEQNELIDVIIRNAQRLKKLSDDILEASKIDSNSLTIYRERFNIKEIVLYIIENYKNNTDIKNISFECNIDDNLTIYADEDGINRVISNLINNSIKFIDNDKGGLISINAEKKKIQGNGNGEEIITVQVKDTGKGIDPEIMPRLFTKFTSRSFQGTGLGLYICKSIVEAHGGR
ncbi:MAG: ATP-binding protein, partial [Candidatus Nitrosocosmicus sp.]